MRILLAPNSFKGTLTGMEAAEAIEKGMRAFFPCAIFDKCPVADGGDGLLDVLSGPCGLRLHTRSVSGPYGGRVRARFGISRRVSGRSVAVIEMAEAAGLRLAPHGALRPLEATTAGVGELMRAACGMGATEIIVGLGGSASNDGGAGCAAAFGFGLLARDGRHIGPGAAGLMELDRIEAAGRAGAGLRVVALADVDNPLCGPRGSARVYGPQKGAGPDDVLFMERALKNYARVAGRDLGRKISRLRGGAAAGGLAAGLHAFFGAEILGGAAFVMERTGLARRAAEADLVVTGEGAFDEQTFYGKAPAAVAALAARFSRPVLVACGSSSVPAGDLGARGLSAVIRVRSRFSMEDIRRDPAGTLEAAVSAYLGSARGRRFLSCLR